MKFNEKLKYDIKVQILKFINSEFDEESIKMLLINIRDELPYESKLKEISHFVAHPERNAGLFQNKISSRFYRIKKINEEMENITIPENATGQFDDYIWANRNNEEIYKIPKNIFKIVIENGIDDFSDLFLINNTGYKREELKQEIKNNYKRNDGFYFLKKEDEKFIKAIWMLKTSSSFKEILKMDELYKEFIKVIEYFAKNFQIEIQKEYNERLKFDFEIIVLSLLNDISYIEDDENVGRAFLSKHGENAVLICNFFPNGKDFKFKLIDSNVKLKEYCDFLPEDFNEIENCKAIRDEFRNLKLEIIDI